jgi:hypothetical protein
VKLSGRTKLIVLAAAAAVLFVAVVAWREAGRPLAYISADRVHGVRAEGVPGRRARDLSPEETAELCALLRAARRIGDFQGPRSVSVELVTADYGRLMVYDFDGPGANLNIDAGGPTERMVSVRSSALGRFLKRLGAELAGSRGSPARPEKAAAP